MENLFEIPFALILKLEIMGFGIGNLVGLLMVSVYRTSLYRKSFGLVSMHVWGFIGAMTAILLLKTGWFLAK